MKVIAELPPITVIVDCAGIKYFRTCYTGDPYYGTTPTWSATQKVEGKNGTVEVAQPISLDKAVKLEEIYQALD